MSCSRHCKIYKAKDQQWYVELAHREYGDLDDATTYGPFSDEASAAEELDWHTNPGGRWTDDSGLEEVPTISPNGDPVCTPSRKNALRPNYFTYIVPH